MNDVLILESGFYGEIQYLYDNKTCIGFIYNNNKYYYIPDDWGNVEYIIDSKSNKLCKYDYSTTLPAVYKYSNNEWIVCTDESFIGNINPIRYQYWYYDLDTNYYYTGLGIYYDIDKNIFIQNDFKFEKIFNHLNEISKSSSNLYLSSSDYWQTVVGLYQVLMNTPNYGVAIDQVSETAWLNGARWYDGLDTYEIVARCLFGENARTDRNNDRAGVACVIANRVNNNHSTLYAEVTKRSQFSTVNPGSYEATVQHTANSISAKSKTNTSWQNATLIACALYYSTDSNDFTSIFSIPIGISNQVQFYGLKNVYNEDRFQVISGSLYQDDDELCDVAIAGIGYINITPSSTKEDLFQYYYNEGYNLFYNFVR